MFAAKPALIASSPSYMPRANTRAPWGTVLCILASDMIALSFVFVLLVAGRQLVTPEYSWSGTLRFLPFFTLAFPALLFQGLYPGLLIHPAEEMRRVFISLTVV